MVARRRPYRVSNFGRVQDTNGVRHFPKIRKTDRRRQCIPPGLRAIGVHQLVYALFPSGEPLRPGDTVDHIGRDRSNNYWRGLRRATWSEQVINQTRTAASMQSNVDKKGVRVRGRCGAGPWRTWDSQHEAARATGVCLGSVNNSINKGRTVPTKTLGTWTFEAAPREDPDLPGERWYALEVDGETLRLSSEGRVRRSGGTQGNGVAHYGTSQDGYRKIEIKDKPHAVHNLIMKVIAQHYTTVGWGDREQWRFAPAPPDDGENYTVEHRDTKCDADGCLSNAFDNLDGWFTKREQVLSAANGSMPGKPVRARHRVTRVETEHANAGAAAAALGLSRSMVRDVCNGTAKSSVYEFSFIPQPDLVRVHTTLVGGCVRTALEIEQWEDVNATDPRVADFRKL
jgi:hypothetical protein